MFELNTFDQVNRFRNRMGQKKLNRPMRVQEVVPVAHVVRGRTPDLTISVSFCPPCDGRQRASKDSERECASCFGSSLNFVGHPGIAKMHVNASYKTLIRFFQRDKYVYISICFLNFSNSDGCSRYVGAYRYHCFNNSALGPVG